MNKSAQYESFYVNHMFCDYVGYQRFHEAFPAVFSMAKNFLTERGANQGVAGLRK